MSSEIKVPSMGESITEATVGEILKPTGSLVAMDDEILELETDKVNQVLYAPKSGVITITVSPGDVVKIGQIIGSIEESAEAPPPEAPKAEVKAPPVKQGSVRKSKEATIAELDAPVVKKEVETPPPPPPKPTGEREETRKPVSKIRSVIAKRLVEVQNETAMLTTFNEVDMTAIMALRTKYKETFAKKYDAKLGFMSFFVKASISALQAYPEVNSYLDGDEIVHREYYDIGIAIGTDRGLVVPVVRDCDQLSFAQVEKEIETYAKKAREGSLALDDLQGGGFTITNGGVYGSLLSTPILNPPQCGILGMHTIQKRAVVVDDAIVIRPMMYLALSYDHRIIDGKEGVSFLVHLKNILEEPSRLLLEV